MFSGEICHERPPHFGYFYLYDLSRIEEYIDREDNLIVQGKRLGGDFRVKNSVISF